MELGRIRNTVWDTHLLPHLLVRKRRKKEKVKNEKSLLGLESVSFTLILIVLGSSVQDRYLLLILGSCEELAIASWRLYGGFSTTITASIQ
jgi:hypothetical protein